MPTEVLQPPLKAAAEAVAEVAASAGPSPVTGLTILALSLLVGALAVRGLTAAKHPVVLAMSSAVAGATIVGGIQWAGDGQFTFSKVCGLIAVVFAGTQVSAAILLLHRHFTPGRPAPLEPAEPVSTPSD
jgi:hypothetical protein